MSELFQEDLRSCDYRLLYDPAGCLPFLSFLKASPVLAIDAETTGLDPHSDRLRLIQIACPGLPVLLFDCQSFLPDGIPCLEEILSSPSEKVFHNAKFDLQFFMNIGIDCFPVFDTMLAAQLIYAALDAAILLKLRDVMVPLLEKHGLNRIAGMEFACASALAHTEYQGIYLDTGSWNRLLAKTETLYKNSLEALYTYSGTPSYQLTLWGGEEALDVNFDSNPYVLKLLNRHGIPVTSTS